MEINGGGVYNEVYDGVAEYGVFRAKIFFVFTIILFFILAGIGIKLSLTDESHLVDTSALITGAVCDSRQINSIDQKKSNRTIYDCVLTVEYSANNMIVGHNIKVSNEIPYMKNEKIEITYDKNDLTKVSKKQTRMATISYVLYTIGIVFFLIGSGNYYFAKKSKFYSATVGAESIMSYM